MATTMAAQFDLWTLQTRQRANAVFREAAEDFVEIMQTVGPNAADPSAGKGGALPVVTGFLRASLQASTSSSPLATRENPNPKASYGYDSGPISLVILGTEIGQTLYIGYSARYAGYVENRYGFVRIAAMQWPELVRKATVRVKNQALGGFARLSE